MVLSLFDLQGTIFNECEMLAVLLFDLLIVRQFLARAVPWSPYVTFHFCMFHDICLLEFGSSQARMNRSSSSASWRS